MAYRFRSPEIKNAKIAGENDVDCILLMLKVTFITNLCRKNRL
jgi:hypothetical protein